MFRKLFLNPIDFLNTLSFLLVTIYLKNKPPRSRAIGKFHLWFVPEKQRPAGFAAEGKVEPWRRVGAPGHALGGGERLRHGLRHSGPFPGQPDRLTLRIQLLRNKYASSFGDSPRGFSGPQLNLVAQKGEVKTNLDPRGRLEQARAGVNTLIVVSGRLSAAASSHRRGRDT